jgi:hypothetical protein
MTSRNAGATITTVVGAIGVFLGLVLTAFTDVAFATLILAVGWFLLLIGVFFLLKSMDWIAGSAEDDCVPKRTCFCEDNPSGNIRQPINTWSNIGFMFVGVVILALLPRNLSGGATLNNPIQVVSFFSVLYGMFVIFLGPGSMFFHASLKKWGGWIDNMSMLFWISFVLIYTIGRIARLDVGIVIVIFLAFNILAGVVTWLKDGWGTPIFAGVVGLWGLLEVIIVIATLASGSINGVTREGGWLLLTAIFFGLAFVVWWFSQTGRPLCNPRSILQGHGLWHLLAAACTFTIWQYLMTEVIVV